MSYTVSFEAGALIKGLGLQVDMAIRQAVATTAQTAQAAWQQSVLQARGLWQPYKDRYAASVKVEISADGYSARIYSDDPMATPIETGIPARDLKKALDTSIKVRTAVGGKHAGQRYLIIPFRHNSSGNDALANAMPEAIYAQAQTLAKSMVTGQVSMRSGIQMSNIKTKGQQMVMRNTYKWGGRLDGPDIAKRFKGMYRFNTSSGKQNSSSYVTFRVMMEGSSGWIVPAQPGRYIVKAVAEQAQQMLRSEVQEAIAGS